MSEMKQELSQSALKLNVEKLREIPCVNSELLGTPEVFYDYDIEDLAPDKWEALDELQGELTEWLHKNTDELTIKQKRLCNTALISLMRMLGSNRQADEDEQNEYYEW